MVEGGTEEGPGQGVRGKTEGEFGIGEVATTEVQGGVELAVFAFEDHEGVGDGGGGIREMLVAGVAFGIRCAWVSDEDGDVMFVDEGFEGLEERRRV